MSSSPLLSMLVRIELPGQPCSTHRVIRYYMEEELVILLFGDGSNDDVDNAKCFQARTHDNLPLQLRIAKERWKYCQQVLDE